MQDDDMTEKAAFTGAEWAGDAGKRWLDGLDGLERMIEPIGTALLQHAGLEAGESVIDIGCGGGWTTRQIARKVGPGGNVVGLDISPGLIDAARMRARADAIPNIRFEIGDAATAMPTGAPFDRLFSRFGTMFFAEPHTAFGNLRHMLADEGRMDLAVWAPASENPWFAETTAVLKRHVELPPPVPRAPGPFALAEHDYLRDILAKAGFGACDIIAWDGLQYIGGPGNGPEEAAAFVLSSMHIGDLVMDCDAETQSAVREGLAMMFATYQGPQGVALPSRALFVTARAGQGGR